MRPHPQWTRPAAGTIKTATVGGSAQQTGSAPAHPPSRPTQHDDHLWVVGGTVFALVAAVATILAWMYSVARDRKADAPEFVIDVARDGGAGWRANLRIVRPSALPLWTIVALRVTGLPKARVATSPDEIGGAANAIIAVCGGQLG